MDPGSGAITPLCKKPENMSACGGIFLLDTGVRQYDVRCRGYPGIPGVPEGMEDASRRGAAPTGDSGLQHTPVGARPQADCSRRGAAPTGDSGLQRSPVGTRPQADCSRRGAAPTDDSGLQHSPVGGSTSGGLFAAGAAPAWRQKQTAKILRLAELVQDDNEGALCRAGPARQNADHPPISISNCTSQRPYSL